MVEGAKRRGATDLFGGAVAVVPVRARGMRRQRLRSGRSQRCGSRSGAIAAAVPGVRVHEDRGAKNSPESHPSGASYNRLNPRPNEATRPLDQTYISVPPIPIQKEKRSEKRACGVGPTRIPR